MIFKRIRIHICIHLYALAPYSFIHACMTGLGSTRTSFQSGVGTLYICIYIYIFTHIHLHDIHAYTRKCIYRHIYTCAVLTYTRIHDRIRKHTVVVSKWHGHLLPTRNRQHAPSSHTARQWLPPKPRYNKVAAVAASCGRCICTSAPLCKYPRPPCVIRTVSDGCCSYRAASCNNHYSTCNNHCNTTRRRCTRAG